MLSFGWLVGWLVGRHEGEHAALRSKSILAGNGNGNGKDRLATKARIHASQRKSKKQDTIFESYSMNYEMTQKLPQCKQCNKQPN